MGALGVRESYRRTGFFCVVLAGLFISASAWGGQPKEAPESPAVRRIDRFMAAYDRHGPGAVLAVVQNGKTVFAKGYGQANLEYDEPITPQTPFYLASVGKQFTAFAIALLESEGKLSLDDPVRKYIPELAEFGKPITLLQLIHHTSGLRNSNALLALAGTRESDLITHQDVLDLILAQHELNFPPGTEHLYSNSGYTLLATVVERVTGQPFSRFMRERVFLPLGMTHSFVMDEADRIVPHRADSYRQSKDGHFRKAIRPYSAYGAGGVYSTADDLTRWLANFETPRVGGKAVKRMNDRGVLSNGYRLNYSFGLDWMRHRGLQFVGHDGSHGGYRNYVGRIPDRAFGVIVLSNVDLFDPCAAAFELTGAFAPDGPKAHPQAPVPVSTARLKAYAGEYMREGGGYSVRLTLEQNRLYLHIAGHKAVLTAVAEDRFRFDVPCIVSGYISFRVNAKGLVEQGAFLGTPIRRIRKQRKAWRPGSKELSQYAGRYYSPELDTFYTIVASDGGLVARHRRNGDIILTPKTRDRFEGDKWFFQELAFERGEKGAVTGMRVSGFRAFNVQLVRKDR